MTSPRNSDFSSIESLLERLWTQLKGTGVLKPFYGGARLEFSRGAGVLSRLGAGGEQRPGLCQIRGAMPFRKSAVDRPHIALNPHARQRHGGAKFIHECALFARGPLCRAIALLGVTRAAAVQQQIAPDALQFGFDPR